MQSSPDFSGSLRRHQDSPNFWLAVLAGSLAVHLLFLLSGRWFLVRVAPVKSRTTATPIELVDLSPRSSGKPAQGVSLTAPKVASAPLENSSGATSSIQPSDQPSESAQPTIVPSPSPKLAPSLKPIQERQPLTDASERLPTQPPLAPTKPDPSAPPIPPEPTSPENTNPPNPSQPLEGDNNPPNPQPTNPDQPNSPRSSSDQNKQPTFPQPPNSGTDPGLPPPGLPGPIGSGQDLPPTEVTIAAQVTASQIRRADPTRNESQATAAKLRGSAQQQITIPYSPDYKLSPGQVLNLDVLFVVNTTTGKVMGSSVPNNSTSLSDAGLDKLVDRVFEPLLFDVTFDTAAVIKAPSVWVVPVQIQVIK